MRITYGTDLYGYVRECDGRFVATKFFHIQYMPLVPLGSMWVTDQSVTEPFNSDLSALAFSRLRGREITFHPLSVVSAYLRTWAPVAAVLCFYNQENLWGGALLGMIPLSWLGRHASAAQRERQRMMVKGTGLSCPPELLPRRRAKKLYTRALEAWRQCHGDEPVEQASADGGDGIKEALRYGVLRLRARANGSRKDRALAETLFQALKKQEEPQQAREAMLRERARTVLEGSRSAFDELAQEQSPRAMTLAWYRPEQWDALRQASSDADGLPATHSEWLTQAQRAMATLHAAGRHVQRMETDVEALVAFCRKHTLEVNRETRARYVLEWAPILEEPQRAAG